MTNRTNFIIHLVAAFCMALLFAAHVVLAVYYLVVSPWPIAQFYIWPCIGGSVWLFVRMIIHCIAAVGREVDQQRRQLAHAETLRKELDESFERAMTSPLRVAGVDRRRVFTGNKAA